MKRKNITPIQVAAHIAALIPLALLFWDFWQGNLGPDIIREATLRTGKAALILLVASLACTPIHIIFKFKPALKLRRPLGLYSFLYASIHFAIFIGVDYFFDLALIKDALLENGWVSRWHYIAGVGTHIYHRMAASIEEKLEKTS
jgi:sulfoxide reductase heme-binding subunit YedZ